MDGRKRESASWIVWKDLLVNHARLPDVFFQSAILHRVYETRRRYRLPPHKPYSKPYNKCFLIQNIVEHLCPLYLNPRLPCAEPRFRTSTKLLVTCGQWPSHKRQDVKHRFVVKMTSFTVQTLFSISCDIISTYALNPLGNEVTLKITHARAHTPHIQKDISIVQVSHSPLPHDKITKSKLFQRAQIRTLRDFHEIRTLSQNVGSGARRQPSLCH